MILQVGQSYPFIRVAFYKKPFSEKRHPYPTDQHMFDPERDELRAIEAYVLTVGGLTYEKSEHTPDGFKRAYHLRGDDGKVWFIPFPEEELSRVWRPFEFMANRQEIGSGISAVFGEELLTAYCRKAEQRKGMLQTKTTSEWAIFYTQLSLFVQEKMNLNPEVYPYIDPHTHRSMPGIPCVKLKPL